jgi:hypothetical protein
VLREIEGRGCKLESTLERVDDAPAGKLLYTVMAGVNAFRSRGDAEKVRMGLRSKHLRGETAGVAPIGYRNVRRFENGREIRTIGVDPERAPLVRTAFDLYASGQHSVAQLAEILENMGLRTRTTPKRPGQPMGKSMVHRMLNNDYFIGVVTLKGEKVEGAHPPLVDPETFERVQQLLRTRAISGTRSRKYEHYLKGSIYCGVCGGLMLYVKAKGHGGVYGYFRCFGRFNAGRDCNATHTACVQVETAVIDEYLRRKILSGAQRERIRVEIESLVGSLVDAAGREIARAQKRLNDLKDEQQKLLQLSYKGLVDEDVLAAEQARIRKEQNDVARWKSVAEKDSEDTLAALDEALRLLAEAPAAYERATPEVRRLLTQAIWKQLWVLDDEIVGAEPQPWVQSVVGFADGADAEQVTKPAQIPVGGAFRSDRFLHAPGLLTAPGGASCCCLGSPAAAPVSSAAAPGSSGAPGTLTGWARVARCLRSCSSSSASSALPFCPRIVSNRTPQWPSFIQTMVPTTGTSPSFATSITNWIGMSGLQGSWRSKRAPAIEISTSWTVTSQGTWIRANMSVFCR